MIDFDYCVVVTLLARRRNKRSPQYRDIEFLDSILISRVKGRVETLPQLTDNIFRFIYGHFASVFNDSKAASVVELSVLKKNNADFGTPVSCRVTSQPPSVSSLYLSFSMADAFKP